MFLARLLYCSIVNGVGDKDVAEILEISQVNNRLDNITGVLIYNGTYFVQCLEGDRRAVSGRFNVIAKDKRHRDLELIDFSLIGKRRFPQWSMNYSGGNALAPEIISAYTAGEFDPRQMPFPDPIIDMMSRLAQ